MPRVLTHDDVAGVRKPLAQAHWLPAHAYTNPAIWPQELERVLRRQWLVVCRADQISQSGSFITKESGGARVLVVRGADGVIRAFHNVCRHRGMWVAEGCGQTRNFVCPYHSWTYDLQGELVAAPEMARTADFDRAEMACRGVQAGMESGVWSPGRYSDEERACCGLASPRCPKKCKGAWRRKLQHLVASLT